MGRKATWICKRRTGWTEAPAPPLAHGIGQLDPFKRVDVHAYIPAVDGGGVKPGQQRKVAHHHQALDVLLR